jgi:hypothetical protein
MKDYAKNILSILDFIPVDELELTEKEKYVRVLLPVSKDSDYGYWIYIYDDGEPQIGAALQEADIGDWKNFWYRPFESCDYPDADARNLDFKEVLSNILKNDTRITYTKKLLFNYFRLEYRSTNGWNGISTCGILRPFTRKQKMELPQIEGKEKVYTATRLIEHNP